MTLVLQHFTKPTEPPIGVWWADGAELKSAYASADSPEEDYAKLTLSTKDASASWDDMFHALESITSPLSQWETADVQIDPAEFLARVRRFKRSA